MKPEGKEYEKEVIIPKVWEEVKGGHFLVHPEVSAYIRELEEEVKTAERLLAEQLQKKNK